MEDALQDQPTLWHIAISHYSEKVRWALDYKSVEHERRTAPPGLHIAVALWLSRGRAFTFPILELDGRRIADSTAIIAALEQRFPEPPLYPADPRSAAGRSSSRSSSTRSSVRTLADFRSTRRVETRN